MNFFAGVCKYFNVKRYLEVYFWSLEWAILKFRKIPRKALIRGGGGGGGFDCLHLYEKRTPLQIFFESFRMFLRFFLNKWGGQVFQGWKLLNCYEWAWPSTSLLDDNGFTTNAPCKVLFTGAEIKFTQSSLDKSFIGSLVMTSVLFDRERIEILGILHIFVSNFAKSFVFSKFLFPILQKCL